MTNATYGNYIDVTLTAPIQSIKLDYWTRFENGNAAPTHIKLFTSVDGNDWTELGEIKSGLPTGANQQYSSPIYRAANPFSHFRFAVLDDLDVGNLAALNVDLNGDHGFAALAFTRVGAIFVGGSLGTDGEQSGSGSDDDLLHDVKFLEYLCAVTCLELFKTDSGRSLCFRSRQ